MRASASLSISDNVPAGKHTGPHHQPPVHSVQISSLPYATAVTPQLKSSCACGGGCPRCEKAVYAQAKLSISQPGDAYEQEADRMADTVMRTPEPVIQRSCAGCSAGGGSCPKCESEEEKKVQRKVGSNANAFDSTVPDNFLNGLGAGQSLDHPTRTFMESSFGADFSGVRVHTDTAAAESAHSVNALAYTVGRNIVFGSGQFNPQSSSGRRLLAHELTHTIQQGAVGGGRESGTPSSSNTLQREPVGEGASSGPSIYDDEFMPEPSSDSENYVVGNSLDMISVQDPYEEESSGTQDLPKPPAVSKKKMGGPLGPVKEGSGGERAPLDPECKEWIKLKRTTYGYDTGDDADSVEKTFVKKYKDFKGGVPISKPEDFNTKLKAATDNPCTCMGQLQIDGHGGSWSGGAQEFAPRKFKDLGDRSFGVKKNADGNIVPYNFQIFDNIKFCRSCSITLGGCYVALNKPKKEAGAGGFEGAGDALGKALSAKTGCYVIAYTDLTTTPEAGQFEGKNDGKWVVTAPETTGK
jgi:hypothetical protein